MSLSKLGRVVGAEGRRPSCRSLANQNGNSAPNPKGRANPPRKNQDGTRIPEGCTRGPGVVRRGSRREIGITTELDGAGSHTAKMIGPRGGRSIHRSGVPGNAGVSWTVG